MPTTRAKPGEGLTRDLNAREERLRGELKKIEAKRQLARDKATGKNKAQAAVLGWLKKLSGPELRQELKLRGQDLDAFESIDQAEEAILVAMFRPEGKPAVIQDVTQNGPAHDAITLDLDPE